MAAIAAVMDEAEINYSHAAHLNLAEAFQEICRDQEAVDLIMRMEKYRDLITALYHMFESEDTGEALKASVAWQSFIRMTQGVWDATSGQYVHQISELLLAGVKSEDKTKSVRYYELALGIATISEQAFTLISSEAINQVLDNFFAMDALTQMVIMDFFVEFEKMPWTGKLTGPFLEKLFLSFRDD